MSRAGSPPSSPPVTPVLPERADGISARPVGSLDRIEVTVHYNTWDVYRMEMAERWRRNHSADAPVVVSPFPLAVVLYLLLEFFYAALAPGAWRGALFPGALSLLFLWAVWWAVAPILQARRQAEAALSESPVRLVFSPDGVEMIRLDVSMKIAWPGIRRLKETWFSILIYPCQSSPYATGPDGRLVQVLPWMKLYFTVPLHCFADAADLRLFRDLIRKHVAAEVKLRA
jgi:hypothetical protein